ncbi:sister chromatid cohesion protein Dcc1 [Phlyctochytrium arcticum]|nr:sister chromatid cohesion protein Dcc1 [Phlyctochytrium arcticum]
MTIAETAVLTFPVNFNPSGHYTLLELPSELAAAFDDNGSLVKKDLIIKGTEDESIVVCTQNATYVVSSVQTSNTLLFAKPTGTAQQQNLSTSYEIQESLACYWELVPCQARLDKLRQLLENALYRGSVQEDIGNQHEKFEGSQYYTTEELLDIIQASEDELRIGLEELGAVEIDGKWRLLESSYQESILKYLLISAAADELDLDNLSVEQCLASMMDSGYSPELIRHTVKYFATEDDDAIDDSSRRKLCASKVGRFIGKQALANAESPKTNLDLFMLDWQSAVPEPFKVDLSMLAGLCLVEDGPTGQSIIYFPKSRLPMDEKGRFEMLFNVRKKWAHEEFVPYISDLAPTTKKLDAILLKYARMFKAGTQVFYTSRYTYFNAAR